MRSKIHHRKSHVDYNMSGFRKGLLRQYKMIILVITTVAFNNFKYLATTSNILFFIFNITKKHKQTCDYHTRERVKILTQRETREERL